MLSTHLNSNNPLILLFVAGFMTVLTGCATTLPRVEKPSIETLPFKAESEGIIVSLKPVTAKDELERNFGNDLLSFGMLPVQVNVTNHNPSVSFIVEGKNFTLNYSAARASRDSLPSPDILYWFPGGLIGATLAANRKNSKVSMALSEFRSYTISPGRFAQGFLFFQLPDKGTIRDTNWRLRIRIQETQSDLEVELEIPFSATLR